LLGSAQHDATSWECDIGKVKVRSHDPTTESAGTLDRVTVVR